MRVLRIFLFASLLLSAAVTTAPAQPNPARGADSSPGVPEGRRYDPKTVDTTPGEITSIELVTATRRGTRGVHLTMVTNRGETLPVHLGPQWYIEQQSVKLAKGDKVEVRGSRITFEDNPVIIAAEVTKDGQTMRLRDEKGVPAWAGWRRPR